MQKTILLWTAMFLVLAVAAYAQSSSSSSQSGSSDQSMQSGSSATTHSSDASKQTSTHRTNNLEGCVVRQETDYFIQPVKGARVHLNGSNQDLSKYVGQEVRISGRYNPYDQNNENSAQATTQPSGAPITGPVGTGKATDQTDQVFVVTRVDKVSDTCPVNTPGNSSNPQ
jgi:hypothetical protein